MKLLAKIFILMVFAATVSLVVYIQTLNQPLPSFFPVHREKTTQPNNNQGTGTIKGRVIIADSTQDHYEGVEVLIYTSDRSKVIERLDVDSSGNYEVDLLPGIYYVSYTSTYSTFQPPMRKVTVKSNLTITENFSINTN